ncbi:hypothetical protein ACWDYJ_17865 [Streptomyces sp. NPDC003042]
MNAYAKHLPTGVIPTSDVRRWGVAAAERWLKAHSPLFFAPAAGSWVLGVLVAAALLLTSWTEGPIEPVGTQWRAYPATVLLVALPLWYRYLPGPTVASAALLAVEAAVALPERPASDPQGRIGLALVCLLSLGALAGSLVRLRARRRQASLALAAAGTARFPLPEPLPVGHGRRGVARMLLGAFLCLAGAGILLDALVQDLGAGAAAPYDAVGQQGFALPPLVLGTTLLGSGWAADLAARRLHDAPQPALIVGIRVSPSGHFWLYPDADETAGRPLVAYAAGERDTRGGVRLLAAGADGQIQRRLHDIDASSEPFEAVLYGVPREGAEIVVEYAVHGAGAGIASSLTAAPLLPRRRHGLDQWNPAGTSHRDTLRRRRERGAGWYGTTRQTRSPGGTKASRETDQRRADNAGGCGGGSGGGSCGGGCGGCGCG